MFGKTNETDSSPKVTKQDIIDYINKMEIRRAGFGGSGVDPVDVYFHIQQIVTMYDAYLKGELENLEKKHEEEIDRLMGNVPEEDQGIGQPVIRSEFQILRELEKISKELNQEIIIYINRMHIKKAVFGGLDSADVYAHIQEIASMQEKMNEKIRKSYENEIIRLHRMIPKDGL